MNWILWAGILVLTIKVFHEKGGPWKTFFIVIGHVFIVSVVYELVGAALLSTLPTLNLPVKTWPPSAEEANAVNALVEKSGILTGPTGVTPYYRDFIPS